MVADKTWDLAEKLRRRLLRALFRRQGHSAHNAAWSDESDRARHFDCEV